MSAGNQIAADTVALLAAAESTYGTEVVPTEGVDMRGDFSLTVDMRVVNIARLWHSQSRKGHQHIPHSLGFSFQVAVSGVELAGTNDGVPGVHPFYIGSGHEAAITGTVAGDNYKITYSPISFGHGSFTMHHYFLDKTSGQVVRLKLLGCRCNIEHVLNANGELLLNVTGAALYAEFEAVAAISMPTSYAYGLLPFKANSITHTFTLDGETAVERSISAWSLTTNFTLAFQESINGTATAEEVMLERGAENAPGGSINPVAKSGDFAATSGSIRGLWEEAGYCEHVLTAANATHSFTYTAPLAQISGAPPMQRDGAFMRFNIPYVLTASDAGDDDYTIEYAQVA